MGDVIPFRQARPGQKHKGKGLCRSGFHKWVIVQEKQFDIREGKLVTLYRCSRCDATRSEQH